MVTSRTGTAKYLRNRARVLSKAKTSGLTHCPGYTDTAGNHHPCGRELNYDVSLLPESAEADHILSPKFGGTDDIDNLTTLCRTCNVQKGDGTRVTAGYGDTTDYPTSRVW